MACEVCDAWFHAKCVCISDEAYRILKDIETCHWFCSACNAKVGKVIPNLVKLSDRTDVVEGRVTKLETDVKINHDKNNENMLKMKTDLIKRIGEVDGKISQLKDDIKNRVTKEEVDQALISQMDKFTEKTKPESFTDIIKEQLEVQQVKWNESVKKQVDESLERVADNIQDVRSSVLETRAQAAEERDKEARRTNIVLYKVLESDDKRAEERKKADIAFCLLLCNNCLNVGITEDDLLHAFRLGRRGDDTNKPRPLMVQFASYTTKNIVMESLYKLRNAEQKFKGVAVAHDLTVKEREECKRMVAEAKVLASQDTSGEYLYCVRGYPGQMKIIKIRVKN